MTLRLTFPDGGAFVAGGTGNVGTGVVKVLAEAGLPVAFTYRNNRDKATNLERMLVDRGLRARSLRMDLQDTPSIDAALDEAEAFGGPLRTIACASGATVPFNRIADFEIAEVEAFFAGDVLAYYRLVNRAIPRLRAAGDGSITVTSTIATDRVIDWDGMSSFSKGAVEALVRRVAAEEGRHDIRCNAVGISWIVDLPIDAALGRKRLADERGNRRVRGRASSTGVARKPQLAGRRRRQHRARCCRRRHRRSPQPAPHGRRADRRPGDRDRSRRHLLRGLADRVAITWATKDRDRVPDRWHRFDGRRSPLSHGAAIRATDPINAVLNYLYALAEIECRLACLTLGLDPGLGLLHADRPGRDSLALDLIEVVRPLVDAHALDLIEGHVFRAADFVETDDGHCRILPPPTHHLAGTLPQWRQQVAPWAEHIVHLLADASPYRVDKTTPLTGRQRREMATARSASRRKGPSVRVSRPARQRAVVPPACLDCGTPVTRQRSYCPACWPARRTEAAQLAPTRVSR